MCRNKLMRHSPQSHRLDSTLNRMNIRRLPFYHKYLACRCLARDTENYRPTLSTMIRNESRNRSRFCDVSTSLRFVIHIAVIRYGFRYGIWRLAEYRKCRFWCWRAAAIVRSSTDSAITLLWSTDWDAESDRRSNARRDAAGNPSQKSSPPRLSNTKINTMNHMIEWWNFPEIQNKDSVDDVNSPPSLYSRAIHAAGSGRNILRTAKYLHWKNFVLPMLLQIRKFHRTPHEVSEKVHSLCWFVVLSDSILSLNSYFQFCVNCIAYVAVITDITWIIIFTLFQFLRVVLLRVAQVCMHGQIQAFLLHNFHEFTIKVKSDFLPSTIIFLFPKSFIWPTTADTAVLHVSLASPGIEPCSEQVSDIRPARARHYRS